MIRDIENAAAVSGIVTVSPGIRIFGKESRKSVSHLLLIRKKYILFYYFYAHKKILSAYLQKYYLKVNFLIFLQINMTKVIISYNSFTNKYPELSFKPEQNYAPASTLSIINGKMRFAERVCIYGEKMPYHCHSKS